MQTDYKNNNTAINDNEHILILMVWSSSCITRRTTCTNVDLIQCKSYDKMQQSKSMVDAQVIILLNATINHPFCRSCRYVRCAVVQAYHLHRIENTTIQFPINNVYEHGFDSMHKLSRWYATIKIDALWYNTTINHPFCRVAIIIELNIQQINCHCWGWLVDYCFDLVERGFDKCTSYQDDMQQSKCMHKLWTTQQSTIHLPRGADHRRGIPIWYMSYNNQPGWMIREWYNKQMAWYEQCIGINLNRQNQNYTTINGRSISIGIFPIWYMSYTTINQDIISIVIFAAFGDIQSETKAAILEAEKRELK